MHMPIYARRSPFCDYFRFEIANVLKIIITAHTNTKLRETETKSETKTFLSRSGVGRAVEQRTRCLKVPA